MALRKKIIDSSGVPVEYHRICFIQSVINNNTSIAVLSYINPDARASESIENPPYRSSVSYCTDYKENMTVEEAYAYLKTLEQFAGAEDI